MNLPASKEMLFITGVKFVRWLWRMELALLILSSLLLLRSLPGTRARMVLKPSINKPLTYPSNDSDSSVCTSKSCKETAKRMLESLNEKQDPCDDFYEFACGGWIREYSSFSNKSAFNVFLRTWFESEEVIRNLLESDIYDSSSAFVKARTYFQSCMRKEAEEENVLKILEGVIEKMGGWHILPNNVGTKQDFDFQKLILVVNNKCYKNTLLFKFYLDRENLILALARDDIDDNDDKVFKDLDKVTKICRMMGANETTARAEFKKVLKLREELVNISEMFEDGDEDSNNIFTLHQWQNFAPFLNWSEYFNGAFSFPDFTLLYNESIYVEDPEYFRRLGRMITKYNGTEEGQKTLRDFMLWHVTLTMFDYLNGSDTNEKLHKIQCVNETVKMFPAPVGAVYVRKMLTNKTKGEVQTMSQSIRQSFKETLQKANWMEEATLQAALDRIDSIGETIGYYDFILNSSKIDNDFAELVVKPNLYYHNRLAHYEFIRLKYVKWLYTSLIFKTWEPDSSIKSQIVPQEARYEHEIDISRIPAYLMQLPFYDENNAMSVNYGALGMVIAHELMHGFSPLFHDWIPEEDEIATTYVNDEVNCITKQYTNYIIGGLHLNGNKTLEEDIADNSGLKASYHAYLNYSKSAQVNYTLPGVKYNHRQQFFIAFAQMWCKVDDGEPKKSIEMDVHTINKFRVIGSLSNLAEFSEEFSCPVGSKMNPKHKCTLW